MSKVQDTHFFQAFKMDFCGFKNHKSLLIRANVSEAMLVNMGLKNSALEPEGIRLEVT